MKKFLSVFLVGAIAICMTATAMAVPMDTSSPSKGVKDDATQKAGGNVYDQTIEALKSLDTRKGDNAPEEVNNTVKVLTPEERTKLDVQAKKQREEYKKNKEDRIKKAQEEQKKKEDERKKAEEEKKKQQIEQEYEKCMEKAKNTYGERAETFCRAAQKKALEKAGLKDDADQLGITPEDERAAKEMEASAEYAECVKRHSPTICQKRLDQAYDGAKKRTLESRSRPSKKRNFRRT